jgi:hypothetical protein
MLDSMTTSDRSVSCHSSCCSIVIVVLVLVLWKSNEVKSRRRQLGPTHDGTGHLRRISDDSDSMTSPSLTTAKQSIDSRLQLLVIQLHSDQLQLLVQYHPIPLSSSLFAVRRLPLLHPTASAEAA